MLQITSILFVQGHIIILYFHFAFCTFSFFVYLFLVSDLEPVICTYQNYYEGCSHVGLTGVNGVGSYKEEYP
jgi:hypothetical protein